MISRLSQDELMPAVDPIKSGVSASDISDAELPPSQSEQESSDNVEDLEKARAELLVIITSFERPFLSVFVIGKQSGTW